ncbi:MAG: hypothetical protein ACT4QC_13435 [Planctomycetaceae bacterium]
MRKALWILSTPVVAGGLAWAVNAADEQAPLPSRSPSAQTGKIYYFSRNHKSAEADADSLAGLSAADPNDLVVDDGAVAERYKRKRPDAPAGARAKNYYRDLFGEGTAAANSSSRGPAASGSRKAANSPTGKKGLLEECGIADQLSEGDDLLPREETPLPPSDADQYELVQGSDDAGGVRHAVHKEREGAKDKSVQHVQHRVKLPPPKAPATRTATRSDDLTDSQGSDADAPAPAPPAANKTAKTPAARTTRPASAARPATGVAAKPARPATTAAAQPATRAAAKPVQTTAAEYEPAPKAAVVQTSAVASESGDVPMISLRWVPRGELNVGQECKCGLAVKNTGKLAARDIVVEAYFPRTVRLLDAEPFPSDSKEHLSWVFERLAAGEEKIIEITMIPGRRGELAPQATVRFTGVASTVLQVEEPQISLHVAGPREISVGETTTQVISVSNPGTGVAHDVVVHASVPEGLEHSRGRSVELGIGSLGPGESREVTLPLTATAGGSSLLKIEARGANLVQRAQAEIKIAAPRLKVEVAGPGLRYVNRHAQYVISVRNEGVAATDNVRVMHLIPEGFEFVKADRGGKFDSGSATASWYLGRVEPGQAIQIAVELNAKRIGDFQHLVQASGENGPIADAKLEGKIDGSAAIVMEVADLDDPVEVDTQTAYEVRIRNDGTKAAQNLRLACELPQGVVLIDTDGPSEHVAEKGGVLQFRPLAELAVGGKVAYRIKVTGKVAGNLRLRAKLTSNAAAEPLIVEELTRFYAD